MQIDTQIPLLPARCADNSGNCRLLDRFTNRFSANSSGHPFHFTLAYPLPHGGDDPLENSDIVEPVDGPEE